MKLFNLKCLITTGLAVIIGSNLLLAQDKIDYSNPALILGTSYGNFFSTLYKIGDFNKMLAFTAIESRNKFKDEKILKQYRAMEFGYTLYLISIQKEDQESVLNYSTQIYGTTCIIRFRVRIENDSIKIILPDSFLLQRIFLYR